MNRRPPRAEAGQAVILLVIAVLVALFLLATVSEVNRAVSRRMAGQDATDAAARAAATWQGRALNVIGNANLAQAMLAIEYVLPMGVSPSERSLLAEAGRDLTALQEEVTATFPALGVVSACAVAREAGLSAIAPEDLDELHFEEAADLVRELEASSDLGAVLGGRVHAVPIPPASGGPPLALGVSRAGREDAAAFAAAFVASGTIGAEAILEVMDAPPSIVPPHPLLFFGYREGGTFEETIQPGIEEEVIELTYHDPNNGALRTASVLSRRGKQKLELFLGHEPTYQSLGSEGFAVVRAFGPLELELAADRLGSSPDSLVARGVERTIQAVLEEGEPFPFSFHVIDSTFWQATGGPAATILARAEGWRSDRFAGGSEPAYFLSRARPLAAEEPWGGVVLPLFDEVHLGPVPDWVREGGR